MGQVTIYLEEDIEQKMIDAATTKKTRQASFRIIQNFLSSLTNQKKLSENPRNFWFPI
jgi:hypothetical protein